MNPHPSFRYGSAIAIWMCVQCSASGQGTSFPYTQNFDLVVPPSLPGGWSSTQNRTPGVNDFTTSSGTARSAPNAVLSTNAIIGQELISPLFDFANNTPERIIFYTRRSASHLAKVVVEASLDSGTTYTRLIGDTVLNPGTTNYVLSSFSLPSILGTSHGVRFRWRIIPDAGGATGTIRIDDILITVQAAVDLTLSGIRFFPPYPEEGDSIQCSATIKNVGLETVQMVGVDFFVDANNDSLPQPSELVASVINGNAIAVGDSVDVVASLGVFSTGEKVIIAKIVYPPDKNPSNDQRHAALKIGYRYGSIVVNEIMYAPASPEPEWVELYNTRSDSINLRGWLVSDSNVLTRRTITTSTIRIPPNGYVVLTSDSAGVAAIHPAVPSRIIDVTSFPTLNNTGDALVLYDDRGKTMDSLYYLLGWGGNTGGKSLERIDPLGSSVTSTNWGTSRIRSTPGVRNSLTRKDFDLRLDSLVVQPPLPIVGATLDLRTRIRNIGFQPVPSFSVLFFEDANHDSLAQPAELIGSVAQPTPVSPLDSIELSLGISGVTAGTHLYMAIISFSADEDTLNNKKVGTAIVGYEPGSLVINEIMYAPPTGVPEWVELLNLSPDSIDLNDWKLGNRSVSPRYTISTSQMIVPPLELVVVTKDTALLRQAYQSLPPGAIQSTSLPTFLWNNNGDAVVFVDNREVIMDSFFYAKTWGGASGTSLERIDGLGPSHDSSNWTSSEDSLGATPGRANSAVALDFDLRILRAPQVIVKNGIPASFLITVQNIGKQTTGAFDLLLFDDMNNDSVGAPEEVIAQVSITQALVRRDSLVIQSTWSMPRPGGYNAIARIEYTQDERISNNKMLIPVKVGSAEHSLVINEIMYAPSGVNAEYIELMNVSDHDIDIANWKITDRPTSSGSVSQMKLSTERKVVRPDEFFLLASDTSMFRLWPHLRTTPPRLITILNQSNISLNNDGDDIIVRDLLGSVVDSVAYQPGWHNSDVADKTGRSLEKINPLLNANDLRSWSTSASPTGGTPGLANSIFAKSLPVQSRLSFSPNPFSPDDDGMDDFTLVQYELPLRTSLINIKIYDVKGRLIRFLSNNEPSGARGVIPWDGRDNENRKARIGMYIVLLEAIDDQGVNLETAKGVVVLAGRL